MSKTGLEDYMMEQLEKAAWRGRMEREMVEEGGAITIPGAPVAKGRPRVYNGRGVTPERTRRWEAAAAAIIRASGVRVVGAVELELVAVMERPQRLCRRADPAGRIPRPSALTSTTWSRPRWMPWSWEARSWTTGRW